MRRSRRAEELLRESVDQARRVPGEEDRDYVSALNVLALTLNDAGKHTEAEPLFCKALDAYLRTFGERHPATLVPLHNVAAVLEKEGRAQEAEVIYRQVVELADEVMPAEHWSRAAFHGTLGNCLITLEQYEEAERHLLVAYNGLKASLGAGSERTRSVLSNVVRLYERWQKPDKAETYREELEATASRDDGNLR